MEELGASSVDGEALDLRVESKGPFDFEIDDRLWVSVFQRSSLGEAVEHATVTRDHLPSDLEHAGTDLDRH